MQVRTIASLSQTLKRKPEKESLQCFASEKNAPKKLHISYPFLGPHQPWGGRVGGVLAPRPQAQRPRVAPRQAPEDGRGRAARPGQDPHLQASIVNPSVPRVQKYKNPPIQL